MKWQAGLEGDREILETLTAIFDSDTLRVSREGNKFFLESSYFEELESVEAVHTEALRLTQLINGAAFLILGVQAKIATTSTIGPRNGAPPPITIHAEAVDLLAQLPKLGKPILNDAVADSLPWPGEDPATLVGLAKSDTQVAKVLDQLQHDGWKWVNLIRLIEIVEEDVGSIPKVGYATDEEMKRLRHSADNPSVAGRDARHARVKFEPPRNPMSQREARQLVERILKFWVNNKRKVV